MPRNISLDDLTYIADADYDAVIIEMEHEGFSFTTLRTSLQVLLNRKRIAEKGNLQPDVVPMVRIPPNARERNQWVIKQALDAGVHATAAGAIDRALKLNPNSAHAWMARGWVAGCQNQPRPAIEALTHALRLAPLILSGIFSAEGLP